MMPASVRMWVVIGGPPCLGELLHERLGVSDGNIGPQFDGGHCGRMWLEYKVGFMT